jgi:hypothetical protein
MKTKQLDENLGLHGYRAKFGHMYDLYVYHRLYI